LTDGLGDRHAADKADASGNTHGERKESRPAAAATGTLSPSKTSKGSLTNDALSCEICPSSSAHAIRQIDSRPLVASMSWARP